MSAPEPSSGWPTSLLCVAAVLALAGCPTDLGTVTLDLWQVPAEGDPPFLDVADAVNIDVTIDGTTTTEPLTDGRIEGLEALAAGSEVSLVLRATGPFGEALARPDPFIVSEELGDRSLPAIMAVGGFTTLDGTAPDARTGAAGCADGRGRAVLAGGEQGGALAFGSFIFDPAAEAVLEGPGVLNRRTGARCVLLDDDVWLFGGCGLDGTGQPLLERAAFATGAFEEAGDAAPSEAGCGVAVAARPEGFALLAGAVVQRRDAEGGIESSHTLPVPHHFGHLAVDQSDRLVVGGGYLTAEKLTRASAGYIIEPDGTVLGNASLAEALLAVGDDEVFAFAEGSVRVLEAEGMWTDVVPAGAIDLPAAFQPQQLLALSAGEFLLMDEAGTEAVRVRPAGTERLPFPADRPGGQLLDAPGGAAFVVGAAAGTLVYIAP